MQLYFPLLFENSNTKEYFDILRERTLLIIDSIISDVESEEISTTTNSLITFNEPSNYIGASGLDIKSEKHFETICISLDQNLHVSSKKMSVLEFYTAYESLKDQIKQSEKKSV